MKALLHVRVPYDFDFDKYLVESIQSLNPDFEHLTKKKRLKPITSDYNGGTPTGELWTWVTTSGNAIHVWETRNTKFNRVVAVELDSRRHATLDPENGVGVLIQGLEHHSGKRREEWDVIRCESYIDKAWYLSSRH
jgi:hypothetical protein